MIDQLVALDTRIFLYLNGMHNPFFDQLMWLFSSKFFWVPLYIWFLWMLQREYRKQFWVILVMIFVMILLSDQVCNLFKNGVMRLRPSNEPSLAGMVHIVKGYTGGSYGFYSAHASNSFAVAVFIVTMLKRQRKYLLPIGLSFALMVSYSRIYLGVHYPLDVLTGILAGSLIAFLITRIYIGGMRRWGKV